VGADSSNITDTDRAFERKLVSNIVTRLSLSLDFFRSLSLSFSLFLFTVCVANRLYE
jgi:hypothetical protein